MNEDRSTRFHRRRRWLGVASAALTGGLLVAMIVTPAGAALVEMTRRMLDSCGLPASTPWLVGGYVVLLGGLNDLLTAPIEFSRGLVLERRYGLSTLGTGAWLLDHAKTAVFGLGVAALALPVLYAVMAAWPSWWWMVGGVLFSAALCGVTLLAPVFVLPLFHRVEPIDREALRQRLATLAGRARTSILGVYSWTIGHRTRRANAALVGLFGTRRIVVSDTMLDRYSDDEIEVVLAHELGHHVHGDIWISLAFEGVAAVGALFAASLALDTVGPIVGIEGPSDVRGVPLLWLSVVVVSWLIRPAANALSRRHERAADAYALASTGNPRAFISAMRRLGAQNLAEESPSRFVRWFCLTHPPLAERIAAAQAVDPSRT